MVNMDSDCKKVWPADEEMKRELRLYDEGHSRDKCISIQYFKHLERELLIHAEGKKIPFCEESRNSLLTCLREANRNKISHCNEKINEFLKCVNITIKETYAEQ